MMMMLIMRLKKKRKKKRKKRAPSGRLCVAALGNPTGCGWHAPTATKKKRHKTKKNENEKTKIRQDYEDRDLFLSFFFPPPVMRPT